MQLKCVLKSTFEYAVNMVTAASLTKCVFIRKCNFHFSGLIHTLDSYQQQAKPSCCCSGVCVR